MERLRVLERKVPRSCINYARPQNSYHYISNADLYTAAEIDRVHIHLCNLTLRFSDSIYWPDLDLLDNYINQDENLLDDARVNVCMNGRMNVFIVYNFPFLSYRY